MATRPAVSPRCVAFTAFPHSQVCLVWTRVNRKPTLIHPVVSSPPLPPPLCTRASSSRGAGAQRTPQPWCHPPCSVLLHLSQPQGLSSSAAVMDLHRSPHLLHPSPSLNPSSITSTRWNTFLKARPSQVQTTAGQDRAMSRARVTSR